MAIVAMACRDGPTSPEVEPSYLLPFPIGDSAQVIQGNNGTFTHFGHAAYAFDFRMTIGRAVTAMRAGRVIAIEGSFVPRVVEVGEVIEVTKATSPRSPRHPR
jgi:hypothetical protein